MWRNSISSVWNGRNQNEIRKLFDAQPGIQRMIISLKGERTGR